MKPSDWEGRIFLVVVLGAVFALKIVFATLMALALEMAQMPGVYPWT